MNMLQLILILLVCGFSHLGCSILEEKVFAVHATKYLPVSGVLKAGLLGDKKIPEELVPDFRCTVHFALGELVRPVKHLMNWEKYPYAVVTPLGDLKDQLINLNCYDTFIFGDYRLTKRAMLVAPNGTKASGPYMIHTYDPKTTTLRQAVDAVIAEQGGWSFKMRTRSSEDRLIEAFFNGQNVNTKEFFSEILTERPHIAFGARFDPLDGNAWLLGEFETDYVMCISNYLKPKDKLTIEEIEYMLKTLPEKFAAVQDYIMQLPVDGREVFTAKKERFDRWLRIMNVDLKLRLNHNKTIVKTKLWKQIVKHASSEKKLYTYFEKKLSKLKSSNHSH